MRNMHLAFDEDIGIHPRRPRRVMPPAREPSPLRQLKPGRRFSPLQLVLIGLVIMLLADFARSFVKSLKKKAAE